MGALCQRLCEPRVHNYVNNYYFQVWKMSDKDEDSVASASFQRGEIPTRSNENIYDVYMIDEVGALQGGFGKVVKGRLKEEPSQLYAIKIIRKTDEFKDSLAMREIELLKKMDHPYIVRFKETYEDSKYFYIVLEYLQGGDLMKLLIAERKLTEEVARELIWQILLATNYLHTQKIVHGDLKPENFVFVKQGSYRMKMIDFGLADILKKRDYLSEFSGSRYFLAPEVIKGQYNEKRDLWSIGVILYQFMAGKLPFYSDNEAELFEKIEIAHFDSTPLEDGTYSSEMIDLCMKLLSRFSDERPSAQEAIFHPWFKEHRERLQKEGKTLITQEMVKSLRTFSVSTYFKQEIIALMAQSFEDENQVENMIKVFFSIDTDFAGTISKDELSLMFSDAQIPLEPAELEDVMRSLYRQDKNFISFLDFTIGTLKPEFFTDLKRLKTLFYILDRDKNGQLSIADLHKCFTRFGRFLPRYKLEGLISEVDINDDREINFEEFFEALRS